MGIARSKYAKGFFALTVFLSMGLANADTTAIWQISVTASNNNGSYPVRPEPSMTRGSLCQHADRYRYPEKIAYCERDVETFTKKEIIRDYEKLGYSIASRRQEFKIDHYYPLCAGGSNNVDNLWPQHKSVYEITDPLEQETCEKMSQGKLSQADAIKLIVEAKNDLKRVKEVREYINRL